MKSRKLLIFILALPAWALLAYLVASRFYTDSKLEPKVRHLYEQDDFAMHELFNTEGFNNFGYWPNPLPTGSISGRVRLDSSLELYRQIAKAAAITSDDTILDVGCGRGGGVRLIAEEIGPAAITGIDFCHRQIEQAKLLVPDSPSITLLQGRSDSLPSKTASIDKVITVGAAQHFSDIDTFVEESYRVLKPGGKLVVSTFFGVEQTAAGRLKLLIPTFKMGIDRCNDLGAFLLTLRRTGFDDIRIVSIGDRVFPGFDAYMEQVGLAGHDWNRNWFRAYESGYIDFVIVIATKAI